MLKTLGAHIKEYKKASILTPIFMAGEVLMETIIPLMMASIVDNGINMGNMRHVYLMGGAMILSAIVSLWFGINGAKNAAYASMGFGKNLRNAMFERIQTYSFANIDRFSTSSLITRITTDVSHTQMAYFMIIRLAMRAPICLIMAMAFSFSINARLACVYLVAVVVLGVLLFTIAKIAMKHFSQTFTKYDAMNESIQENITGIRVVKSFVRGEHEKKKFFGTSMNVYKMFSKAESVIVWNSPLMSLTVSCCVLFISWFGAQYIIGGSMETGDLMAMLSYCMSILMNLMMLSMVFVMISISLAAGRRICEVLKEDSTITNPEEPIYEVADGSIEFDNVSFRYSQTSEAPVLDNINLKIASGETIGIIGGTGSS